MVDQTTNTPVLLVTANVGSIFEDPDRMLKLWLDEFQKTIKSLQPNFIGLHLQEVGGKNYEASMQHVNLFVKSMFRHDSLLRYDRAQVFLDEDYTASDKFTALGNIYFIHENIDRADIWSFTEFKFHPVEGKEVLSGNIESIGTKEKSKFPQHFFPEFKWSRKGFIRTRWNLNNCIFDLVNIHLFHDASNIVAMQNSPSTYSGNRQQTLLHTLQRFDSDNYAKVPMFLFGDFNFRLDLNLLVKAITNKLISCEDVGKKDQLSKVTFAEEGDGEKPVLTVSSKRFDHHHKHASVFGTPEKWLHDYDRETIPFHDRLFEFDITFSPSYPFSEDVDDGVSYMKTRCPAWCDRILMSHSAKQIIQQDDKRRPKYNILGKSICMGDHKPVFLYFHLITGRGNYDVNPSPRTRSMSINRGAEVPVVSDDWSIHDNAVFSDESCLYDNSGYLTSKKRPSAAKASFYSLVKNVQAMRNVLAAWPRLHHHSSSSEDESAESSVMNPRKQPHSPLKSPVVSKVRKTDDVLTDEFNQFDKTKSGSDGSETDRYICSESESESETASCSTKCQWNVEKADVSSNALQNKDELGFNGTETNRYTCIESEFSTNESSAYCNSGKSFSESIPYETETESTPQKLIDVFTEKCTSDPNEPSDVGKSSSSLCGPEVTRGEVHSGICGDDEVHSGICGDGADVASRVDPLHAATL